VLQRYAFAAVFSTGVLMPIGFEYGFHRRLDVVKTTPQDWEEAGWDLTGAIREIHRTKAALRPLNEEGPITPAPVGNDRCVAFRKQARDGAEAVLIVLNLDRTAPASVRIPATAFASSRRVAIDPATGISRAVTDADLALDPSGILVVHQAEPPAPVTGARVQRVCMMS